MTNEPLLALDGLQVGYGEHRVCGEISLTADAGASVALIGANGSGKSTILRTIAGQLPPLAWFVLSLIIVGVAAESAADFPRAQLRSVPAARAFLRVAGELTVAGVPVLLVALP
ncbi:MAG: ATP-binding cassette domain-containing protein [Streptosporangiaceae bacterium]